jgi:hypothetical protein
MILMGKPEGRGPIVRHRRRREDNIKIKCLRNRMGCYGLGSFGLG